MIDRDRPLVLDTHTWFWLAIGDPEFVKSERMNRLKNDLWTYNLQISSISLWEISMLESKARIILKQDCLSWLLQSIEKTRLRVIDLTPEISVMANRLPAEFHGDPADRIIVATTRITNGVLLTRDARILKYGAAGFVDTIKI